MDSKTCEIVQLYADSADSADADGASSRLVSWGGASESVVAVVWGEEPDADVFDRLATWPALHFSVGSRPYALALQSSPFAVTTTTIHEARGAELVWSDPQLKATATLRMSAPEAFQEDDSGSLKPRSHAPRAEAEDGPASPDLPRLEVTQWSGELSITTEAGTWQLKVIVQSLCG